MAANASPELTIYHMLYIICYIIYIILYSNIIQPAAVRPASNQKLLRGEGGPDCLPSDHALHHEVARFRVYRAYRDYRAYRVYRV